MIWRYLRIIAIIMFFGIIMMPPTTGAETQLDSVLGIPWGASPEQARKIMVANGYSHSWELPDNPGYPHPRGKPVLGFARGTYGSLPATVYVGFKMGKMWSLDAEIFEDEIGTESAFNTIYKRLTEKYGPKSRVEYRKWPVSKGAAPKMPDKRPLQNEVTHTTYVWVMDGGTKTIVLIKAPADIPSTSDGEEWRFRDKVTVIYQNIQLFEELEKKGI